MAKPEGTDRQVCIDHIAGRSLSQKLTNSSAVIESVDGDRLEECSETSLPRTSPHLCNDGGGCVECSPRSDHSCQERLGRSFAAVNRDEHSGVEDHSPYRSDIAATWSSFAGPDSLSQSSRNDRRASCRRRSEASERRAWRIALDRPPYSVASMSSRARSSSSSRTVVVPIAPSVARSYYLEFAKLFSGVEPGRGTGLLNWATAWA